MMQESAPEASQLNTASRSAHRSVGMRRLSLAMLATAKIAEDFTGSPEGQGATRPGQVLAAFKAAAPYLGLSPRVIHAIDWLFTFTQPQDWVEGSRPVVWPSAALQREALSLGVSQAKAINRSLVELGLVAMKDSPNGKRYGKRNAKGRIIEAYGFDLSPLFTRMAEFQEMAARGRADRERMRLLRRRTTIARNGLLQILDTAAEQGFYDTAWEALEREGRALARSLRTVEALDEMEHGIVSLERRQLEARERLERQLADLASRPSSSVENTPMGPENRPHQYNYKPNCYPKKDVAAYDKGRAFSALPGSNEPTSGVHRDDQAGQGRTPARRDSGGVLGVTTDELVRLAPRLRPYLRSPAPAWPEIVDAADWLRHDLGVSKPLWGEACLALGREQAAIALAIVSMKPVEHFTSSPGSYFFGMVERAKSGQLNLSRTIWGIRSGTKARNGRPLLYHGGRNHETTNS